MTGASEETLIRIVAVVAMNAQGEILLVRKRGTTAFMLPGGKPAGDESALDALAREVREELGCGFDPDACRSLGIFRAPAAHEPGFTVQAELFAARLDSDPRPCGEIDELVWIDPEAEPAYPLAELARRHALPLARRMKSNGRKFGP